MGSAKVPVENKTGDSSAFQASGQLLQGFACTGFRLFLQKHFCQHGSETKNRKQKI
jgi:hypothetical protein